MGIGEDRAFILSLRDTLRSEFPLSNEKNFASMASYFSFWNIADVLILSGMDISTEELAGKLNTQSYLDGVSSRIQAAKSAVEEMFELGQSDAWDVRKIARMRGELDHLGGYREASIDSEISQLIALSDSLFPLDVASDCFLTTFVEGVSRRGREIAYLSANSYLLQNGFVPIIIGVDKLDTLNSSVSIFLEKGDASSFRSFFYRQEFIAIYNYLAHRLKGSGKKLPASSTTSGETTARKA